MTKKDVHAIGTITPIKCSHCKKQPMRIARGTETDKMLVCDDDEGCGQYVYYIGGACCTMYLDNKIPSRQLFERTVGVQRLTSAAQKAIERFERIAHGRLS